MDFNYKAPDENNYLTTLIKYLIHNKEGAIASLLEGSKCKILDSSQFSRRRWNGMQTEISFEVPFNKLELVTDEIKTKLIKYCDDIMPKDTGFDVMSVDFKPRLDVEEKPDVILDLDKTISVISVMSWYTIVYYSRKYNYSLGEHHGATKRKNRCCLSEPTMPLLPKRSWERNYQKR